MKGFLFRARRSGWLHGLILVIFSLLGSLTIAVVMLAHAMLRFGTEDAMRSADWYDLVNWLEKVYIPYDDVSYFLMKLTALAEMLSESFHFYEMLILLFSILLFIMFIYLMACAGYHGKEKSPCLQGLERIPYDLLVPCMIAWTVCVFIGISQAFFYYYMGYILICLLSWITVLIGSILYFLMITVAKVRTGTLFSGMLLTRAGRLLLYFIKKIPTVWKAASAWGGILFFIYWFVYLIYENARWYYDYSFIGSTFGIIWLLIVLTLFFGGLWMILQMDVIRRKARTLAEGNLSEEVQNSKRCPLLPAFKNCLQDLDRISDGMNIVVEEKMKSERFQTELITNVSHDIKTPLTSIINYLDFLSQEENKENRNPQIVQEYMEVLDRQSVRLKKLIEDLIEASKASTGSLNIKKEPCELRIFLQQIAGEYEERLEKAQLTLNLSLPEKEIYVEADGRYLWRVVDNLLQNACKYAMAGTRIYLQLQEKAGQAIITIKNISALELNIPAEELMERFVRGDRSRHSEGSGLGLSIAKSLTELQDGKFALEIDGDLFKTSITFSISPQNEV